MSTADDTILRREPLTAANLDMLDRTLSPIQRMVLRIGEVDPSKGAGVLSNNRKCIWTRDNHRITFTMITGGGLMGTVSKEPDPEAIASLTD